MRSSSAAGRADRAARADRADHADHDDRADHDADDDDASFPASIDNTSAVIDITSPKTTHFEFRTPTGISRRVTSGCRHRRAGPDAARAERTAAAER